MKRRWLAWVTLLSRREAGTGFALLRIAVALIMLLSVLSVIRHDLVTVLWVDQAHGGIRPVQPGFWPLNVLGGTTPSGVWTAIGISLIASTAMLVGLGGRATVFVALYAYRTVSSTGFVNGGYDAMIYNAAWLLVLAQSTQTLSLDCRIRRGRWHDDTAVPAWPRYLMIVQLVVVYLATGLQKASASWNFADGYSALYWFLQDPTWLRFDTSWTASAYPLTQVLTAIVWHFEVGAPLLLVGYYFRYTATAHADAETGRLRRFLQRYDWRIPFAVIGLGMHAGIWLLLTMGPFPWISMAYYIALVTAAEWQQIALGLRERWQRLRHDPEAAASEVVDG